MGSAIVRELIEWCCGARESRSARQLRKAEDTIEHLMDQLASQNCCPQPTYSRSCDKTLFVNPWPEG